MCLRRRADILGLFWCRSPLRVSDFAKAAQKSASCESTSGPPDEYQLRNEYIGTNPQLAFSKTAYYFAPPNWPLKTDSHQADFCTAVTKALTLR